jgi:hypothetical protein
MSRTDPVSPHSRNRSGLALDWRDNIGTRLGVEVK